MKKIIILLMGIILIGGTARAQLPQLVTFFGNNSGGGYGYSVAGIGDFNGDGLDDFVVPSINGNGVGSGSARVYFGRSPYPVAPPAPDITINATVTGELFGNCAAGNFDINGDGFKDFMICATQFNGNTGRVYIFFGGCDIPATLSAANADIIINGEGTGNYFGKSASTAGDFNGDCIDDIIIGAPYFNGSVGRAYIVRGRKDYPSSNVPVTVNNIPGVRTINGQIASGLFGYSVSCLGNMGGNAGDNLSDVIIGAPGTTTGRTYIVNGVIPSSPVVVGAPMVGGAASDFGIAVAGIGDINGNGFNDFIVGDWIFPTASTGSMFTYDGQANALIYSSSGPVSANNAGRFGNIVSGIGDYTGDGYNDCLIGNYQFAPAAASNNRGRVYRYNGGSPSSTVIDFIGLGQTNNSFVGCFTSWAGDINGDGTNDILWSGYGVQNFGVSVGSVELLLAPPSLSFVEISVRAFIQGRYNYHSSTHTQIPTKVRLCIYNIQGKFIDEKIVTLDENGMAIGADGLSPKFNNFPPSLITDGYYIVIKDLCSGVLSTWSSEPITITRGAMQSYYWDFTYDAGQAFGSNQAQVEPGIFAIYSGDVNGDCAVDLYDAAVVDNDVFFFVTSDCCTKTDLDGDGEVAIKDLALMDNNMSEFIFCQSPVPMCP